MPHTVCVLTAILTISSLLHLSNKLLVTISLTSQSVYHRPFLAYKQIKVQLMHIDLFVTKFQINVSANVGHPQGVLLQNTSSVVHGHLFTRVD